MASTREQIIEATTRLFCAQGFNGTSLKQISAESDATIGSIYHFFPGGKDELGLAVTYEAGVTFGSTLESIVAQSDNLPSGFRSIFNWAAEELTKSGFDDPSSLGGIAREVAGSNEPLREAISHAMTSSMQGLSMQLRVGGMGEAKALQLAGTVLSTLEGAISLARTTQQTEALQTTGRHVELLVSAALI